MAFRLTVDKLSDSDKRLGWEHFMNYLEVIDQEEFMLTKLTKARHLHGIPAHLKH